ncbi:Ltp family lipoprotein [Corynebacterium xerosis]|uniref:Ltp family lipoprotein n=1 Tax=Corynebacterium xerosis TaxID=1725 RepID=UPI00366F7B24
MPTTPQRGQPQYGAHPEQEKPKKGGCLQWGAIGLGAIVVLAVLGSMLGGGDDATSTAADETTTTAATTTDGNDAAAPTPDAPAPAADPTPAEQEPAEEDVPEEFKSALRKADTYAHTMHMSKAGLYDQLTSEYGESFSPEEAESAIANL